MSRTSATAAVLATLLCCAQQDPSDQDQEVNAIPQSRNPIALLADLSFQPIPRWEGIPSVIRANLEERFKETPANPGQNYQVGDVLENPRLPWRRMIEAGAAVDLVYIWYEHGGRGRHEHFLLYEDAALIYHATAYAPDFKTLAHQVAAGAIPNDLQRDEF